MDQEYWHVSLFDLARLVPIFIYCGSNLYDVHWDRNPKEQREDLH